MNRTHPIPEEHSPSPGSADPDPEGETEAVLSRELNELLLRLSTAVHRYAMYPPGHPSLRPAVEKVLGRLRALLEDRRNLPIGVAQHQLIVDGVTTDAGHPVLKDLALRLHRHQLGAVVLLRGVNLPEMEEALAVLAEESDPEEGRPLGFLPRERMPDWEHIHLYPLGYDQLEISDGPGHEGGEPARVTQLWVALAQASMALAEAPDPSTVPGGAALARTISRHDRDEAYDRAISGHLRQLAEELASSESWEAKAIRQRMSELVAGLDRETLARLVDMGGSFTRRKRFILDANQGLAVDAVMKLVSAAADASGTTISTSMTRLLSKLALHAEDGPGKVRSQADSALRDNVEELLEEWELKDPNPDSYTLALDAMSRSSALMLQGREEGDDLEHDAPIRLLRMAVEADASGPTVEKALEELLDGGKLAVTLETLDHAPPRNRTAARFTARLTTTETLERLLGGSDVEEAVLRSLVNRIGPDAVETLMSSLTESESRSIRRKVFDCLAKLDPLGFPVADAAITRLGDPRWFVKRNMLGLLDEFENLPESFSGLSYLRHSEARVRREAFPLAVRPPGDRTEALEMALADQDERLVRIALVYGQGELPEKAARVVVDRIIEGDEMPELVLPAVRALRHSPTESAFQGLLSAATGRKTFLGRRKLAEKSPHLLVALAGLREHWSEEREARRLLRIASRHRDPQIQAVASGGSRS